MSNAGSNRLRSQLVMSANVARRIDPELARFYFPRWSSPVRTTTGPSASWRHAWPTGPGSRCRVESRLVVAGAQGRARRRRNYADRSERHAGRRPCGTRRNRQRQRPGRHNPEVGMMCLRAIRLGPPLGRRRWS
jgi:hypothetical protein